MFRILVGFAVGYVLGARAGRARYDQIARVVQRVADHPAVQGAAGFMQGKMSGLLHPGPEPGRRDAAYLDSAESVDRATSPLTASTRPSDLVRGVGPTGRGRPPQDDRPLNAGPTLP